MDNGIFTVPRLVNLSSPPKRKTCLDGLDFTHHLISRSMVDILFHKLCGHIRYQATFSFPRRTQSLFQGTAKCPGSVQNGVRVLVGVPRRILLSSESIWIWFSCRPKIWGMVRPSVFLGISFVMVGFKSLRFLGTSLSLAGMGPPLECGALLPWNTVEVYPRERSTRYLVRHLFVVINRKTNGISAINHTDKYGDHKMMFASLRCQRQCSPRFIVC